MHEISYNQRGNLLLLDEMCDSLGLSGIQRRSNTGLSGFFNSLPSKTLLQLIAVQEGVYGFLNWPTDKLTRLQELKWKL